ncbi:MAG: ribonuclease R [Clostridiales bacterium]|nr:ribonuclease R [Clostridiales bacterium]
MNAKESLLNKFLDGTLALKNATEICKILDIPYREKNRLLSILDKLCEEGEIYQNDGGRYGTIEQLGLIKGVISGNERGFAFLVPENQQQYPDDFFIPHKNLHGALHGDTVLAEKVFFGREDDEVNVVKILARGYEKIVGTFHKDRRAGYLTPDESKFSTDIYIPLNDCYNIKSGVKAVAKITSYPYGKSPGGVIVEILGDEDDFFAEELSIIRSYDLIEEFPEKIIKEAEKQQARGITEKDLFNRRDFRDKLIVTIDGEDTRDIDDAVALEKTDDGYLLSVHIADVSHYVGYRSPLDLEAYNRGTSVYFPDRVLPMLPKALSNGICSLNEGEDRLTLSCIMHLDKKGGLKSSEIVEGVIRSTHKMTYTEVTKLLDDDEQICQKYADVKDMVCLFAELTKILQENRNKKGSISLDVKEAKIILDENMEIRIPDYERAFSYQIIEAFMVLANEAVAEYMHSIEAPFIYRIHEKPSEEKATVFRSFAQTLGLTARFHADDVKPYDYQNLLKSAEDLPIYSVLNRVMLRSMQKARYSHENAGHFGLASSCYCHFTSPIRRYPDLCIHRIIKEIINGGYGTAVDRYSEFVQRAAKHSSERERKAADAERDVDDLYMAMYMSERIGEEYDAVISGVTSFGLFAELPNTIEGLIPIESLYGEYTHDPDRFCLIGRDKTYTIGESVRVKVDDVDFYRRRTEFRLLEKYENEVPVYETNAKRRRK